MEQEVAAPLPALAPLFAQAPLHPRSKRLRVRGIPIVRGYVPHHRRQAKLRHSAQHVRTARAERRSKPFHRFADGILDDSASEPASSSRTRTGRSQSKEDRSSWDSHQVASLMHRPGYFRTPAHVATHQEEGCTQLVAS